MVVSWATKGEVAEGRVSLSFCILTCILCSCWSRRLVLRQGLLERHCAGEGGAPFSVCTTLKAVHGSVIAVEQRNSEHYVKSIMVRGYTVTAPSNIDKAGLLIRAGV